MNLAFSNLLGYSDISIGPTKFHSRQTPTCFVQNFPFELHIIIRTRAFGYVSTGTAWREDKRKQVLLVRMTTYCILVH